MVIHIISGLGRDSYLTLFPLVPLDRLTNNRFHRRVMMAITNLILNISYICRSLPVVCRVNDTIETWW